MHENAILIFAKTPQAGRVKTRLTPALGERGAYALYITLLERELAWICREPDCAVELWVTPQTDHPVFRRLVRRHALTLHLQQGRDLGERMGHASRQALAHYRRLLLLGVDCPALTSEHLRRALQWLAEGEDAVLGPALDGGYVLLGIKAWEERLFRGHEWGGEGVAETTRAAMREAGWRWRELPPLWDLDRPEDLLKLADLGIGGYENVSSRRSRTQPPNSR